LGRIRRVLSTGTSSLTFVRADRDTFVADCGFEPPRRPYESPMQPLHLTAMLLINKDLNLNPVSPFTGCNSTCHYSVLLCAIHHNHSDSFEPISHRLITPMIYF
jgi:hypothetical protein